MSNLNIRNATLDLGAKVLGLVMAFELMIVTTPTIV